MWIRKGDRDRALGVDSPIPTQVVSNEEFLPRPQTEKQKQVESLTMEMGTENAKKLNMSRRQYMASSMGIATAFLAQNKVFGQVWDVAPEESFELAAVEQKLTGGKKGKYFIIDVQAHFSNIGPIGNFRASETARNMGFQL